LIPQLSAITVGIGIAERLRLGWSSRDCRISLLPREYPRLLPSPRLVVTPASPRDYDRGFHRGHTSPATAPLGPIIEAIARSGGIPVATATPLAHCLFGELFTLPKSLGKTPGTPPPPVRLSPIAEVSPLVHPVGPRPLSQCRSGGSRSHGPYPS
jgi:hypothetical protein